MISKLKSGNEVKITTKDGKTFEGIFMKKHGGHLSTIAGLGIILTFPIHTIVNIVKI
tara:strand:- start:12526 stop:12696 length:171 start_codon:yes stop_codon:yes gene_type:complete